jgi:ligand-binding sensor domain-containing protein
LQLTVDLPYLKIIIMKSLAILFCAISVSAFGQTINRQGLPFAAKSDSQLTNASITPMPLGVKEFNYEIAPDNNVHSIFRDRKGNLWFGASNGFFQSTDNGEIFKCGESTCNHDTQVKRMKYLHEIEIEKHFINVLKDRELIDFHINCVAQDAQGVFWIGTKYHGLCRYDGKELSFYSKLDGLGDNWVNSILIAKDGTIWLGTEGGVGKSLASSIKNGVVNKFTNYKVADGLPSNQVNALIQDNSGQIWIATDKGLSIAANNKFITPKLTGDQLTGKLRTMEQEKNGVIWVGDDKGIVRIDQQKSKRIGKAQGLKETRISALHKDAAGNIWAGLLDEKEKNVGLVKIDIAGFNNTSGKLKITSIAPPFINAEIQTIYEDISGILWIGTSNGVGCFKNGEFHWLAANMEGC